MWPMSHILDTPVVDKQIHLSQPGKNLSLCVLQSVLTAFIIKHLYYVSYVLQLFL